MFVPVVVDVMYVVDREMVIILATHGGDHTLLGVPGLEVMANPFEQAMQNTLDRIGAEQDQELINYSKLKDHHFRALTR